MGNECQLSLLCFILELRWPAAGGMFCEGDKASHLHFACCYELSEKPGELEMLTWRIDKVRKF